MKKQTIEVYEFSELGKEAKEKARDNFRQSCLDYDWWDFIYEGIIEKAEEYGITLEDEDIQFTGFCVRAMVLVSLAKKSITINSRKKQELK